jgi:serine/threonine protein kinase
VRSQVAAITGEHNGVLCLVLPAADGNLELIISAERIPGMDLKAIKAFEVDIAGALQYLHNNKQLVHGDVKPRNIVRINCNFKLIDFDASVPVLITIRANHGYITSWLF